MRNDIQIILIVILVNLKCKDDKQSVQDEVAMEVNLKPTENEYKTRLEQKIVISKENPDPVFDLSDCNLEKVPISFAYLKVIRKEVLILGKNRLKSLASGGDLKELELLKVLDLSHNRFKAIPAEICHLKNIRVSHKNILMHIHILISNTHILLCHLF